MKLKTLFLTALTLPVSSQAASLLIGGHMDGPAFAYESGSGFEPHYHNHGGAEGAVIDGIVQTTESEYETDELIVVVPQVSTITVASTTYYWLPEGHDDAAVAGSPFLGIGLEELSAADWVGGTVRITLNSFSGPGEYLLWQDDGLGGQNLFLDTAGNIDSFTLAAGSHTHFNWGFAELGTYELEFEISGNHVTDGGQSESAVYTFQAIPEPSSALLGALGGLALLRRRRL